MEPRGSPQRFIVDINFQNNATWQGVIHKADKSEAIPFRSALELLKIIDASLDMPLGDDVSGAQDYRKFKTADHE